MTLNELLNPFEYLTLPVGTMVEIGIEWLVDNFRTAFLAIKQPVDFVLSNIDYMLQSIPQLLSLTLIWILAWQIGGRRTGYTVLICMTSVGLLGIWSESMTTLAIVLTSIIFCSLVGVPIGIIIAKFDKFQTIVRPILDTMQTIPSFVYLVPVVMLFGIGNVPGVIVTIIYALPPVIRLTNLGIRQVRLDTVEAARAFGASPLQTLFKVEIPLALPTIMTGINQTIMMSLSMVVIASMIAVSGLGQMVLRGIGRLDMGLATVGGLGIVLLAIAVDRISQGFGITSREWGHRKWYQRGPIGLVVGASPYVVKRYLQPSAAASRRQLTPRSDGSPSPGALVVNDDKQDQRFEN